MLQRARRYVDYVGMQVKKDFSVGLSIASTRYDRCVS